MVQDCDSMYSQYWHNYFSMQSSPNHVSETGEHAIMDKTAQQFSVPVGDFEACFYYKRGMAADVFSSIAYHCLPLMREYHEYTNNYTGEFPSPEAYPNLSEFVSYDGWAYVTEAIADCEVYEQCPWDDMEKLPSQRFFEANATEVEVNEARDAFLTQHGSGPTNISDCFWPFYLSMRKMIQDCDPMYSQYWHNNLDKYWLENLSETEEDALINKTAHQFSVSIDDLDACLNYKMSMEAEISFVLDDDTAKLIFKIITCIFASFGLFGNVALFIIYWKKDWKVRFNLSMMLIITWDTLFVIFQMLDAGLEFAFSSNEDLDATLERILRFMYWFTFGGTVYTTTLTAIERYLILSKNV